MTPYDVTETLKTSLRLVDSASEIETLLCVAIVEEILLCVHSVREEISLLDLTSNIKIGYIIY